MKNILVILFVFSIALAAGSKDSTQGPLPSWQQSETLNIQLGVRDRNASMEFYEAVFIVQTKEDEKIFEAKLKVNTDEWGFVSFPEDFSVSAPDGEYEWKCTVEGKKVSSGTFTFRQDQRELTLPEK